MRLKSLFSYLYYRFSFPRKGILFCMRRDPESFYSPAEIKDLMARFHGVKTDLSDTTPDFPGKKIVADRETVLKETFARYAHYRVIITDRYHGTIFSLIAGTPVIVIASANQKLSSGVDWFPREIFGEYISFAATLDEAFCQAQQRLLHPPRTGLPPYFKEHFYDHLKELINGTV